MKCSYIYKIWTTTAGKISIYQKCAVPKSHTRCSQWHSRPPRTYILHQTKCDFIKWLYSLFRILRCLDHFIYISYVSKNELIAFMCAKCDCQEARVNYICLRFVENALILFCRLFFPLRNETSFKVIHSQSHIHRTLVHWYTHKSTGPDDNKFSSCHMQHWNSQQILSDHQYNFMGQQLHFCWKSQLLKSFLKLIWS